MAHSNSRRRNCSLCTPSGMCCRQPKPRQCAGCPYDICDDEDSCCFVKQKKCYRKPCFREMVSSWETDCGQCTRPCCNKTSCSSCVALPTPYCRKTPCSCATCVQPAPPPCCKLPTCGSCCEPPPQPCYKPSPCCKPSCSSCCEPPPQPCYKPTPCYKPPSCSSCCEPTPQQVCYTSCVKPAPPPPQQPCCKTQQVCCTSCVKPPPNPPQQPCCKTQQVCCTSCVKPPPNPPQQPWCKPSPCCSKCVEPPPSCSQRTYYPPPIEPCEPCATTCKGKLKESFCNYSQQNPECCDYTPHSKGFTDVCKSSCDRCYVKVKPFCRKPHFMDIVSEWGKSCEKECTRCTRACGGGPSNNCQRRCTSCCERGNQPYCSYSMCHPECCDFKPHSKGYTDICQAGCEECYVKVQPCCQKPACTDITSEWGKSCCLNKRCKQYSPCPPCPTPAPCAPCSCSRCVPPTKCSCWRCLPSVPSCNSCNSCITTTPKKSSCCIRTKCSCSRCTPTPSCNRCIPNVPSCYSCNSCNSCAVLRCRKRKPCGSACCSKAAFNRARETTYRTKCTTACGSGGARCNAKPVFIRNREHARALAASSCCRLITKPSISCVRKTPSCCRKDICRRVWNRSGSCDGSRCSIQRRCYEPGCSNRCLVVPPPRCRRTCCRSRGGLAEAIPKQETQQQDSKAKAEDKAEPEPEEKENENCNCIVTCKRPSSYPEDGQQKQPPYQLTYWNLCQMIKANIQNSTGNAKKKVKRNFLCNLDQLSNRFQAGMCTDIAPFKNNDLSRSVSFIISNQKQTPESETSSTIQFPTINPMLNLSKDEQRKQMEMQFELTYIDRELLEYKENLLTMKTNLMKRFKIKDSQA